MKIANLYVSNFLGAAAVEVSTPEPVQLFCGANGAGKSSLRDAVALALTADLGRVSLKKEAAALITDGADAAVCQVTDSDGDQYVVSINRAGKITNSRDRVDPDPVLPYVLDAQRLARLDATERRAFLFGLMGVKMDSGDIARRLEAKGCHIGKVQRILPLLRAGFDPASKEAKAKATEAKGAWRVVTGETYGSEKAKTWRATVPPYDAKVVAKLTTELQHLDVAAEQWQQAIGKLQAEEQRRAAQRAKLPALQEHAARIERISDKLARDEQSLADWEADLIKTAAAAGAGPRVGLVHDLAEQMMAIVLHGDRVGWFDNREDKPLRDEAQSLVDRYEAEHGKVGATAGDAKAAARLPSVRNSRDLMASAVANGKRDLAAAQAAKAEADAITAELAEVFDTAELTEARSQAETLKTQRAAIVAKLDAQKSIKAQVDAAEAKTKGAAQHAEDVAAWDAIGDALSPDGIPGEMLAEALAPMNARLATAADDADWPLVVIGPDMAITADGREYRLLSESEQWRVDAMLAEAVSHLSGAQLLVLDRFDVLDLQGRQQLLVWLDTLAETGEIATALIFGTLKAAPANLPSTIATHWIENGVCALMKEAA